MAEQLRALAQALALVAEALGAAVVLVALVRGVWLYLRDLLGREGDKPRLYVSVGWGGSRLETSLRSDAWS